MDFQKYFTEYQKKFGLIGYKVYFKYEPLDCFANITTNDMVATVGLNSRLLAKDKPFLNVKQSAKHEALHLLLSKLDDLAYNRFINKDQIYEAVEEIVFKLEELVGD